MILLLGLCALGSVVGIVLIASDRSAPAPGALANVEVVQPVSPVRMRRLQRLSAASAALALVWMVGAVVALFFVPMITSESSRSTAGSDVVTVSRETRPLIQASGSVRVAAAMVAVLVVAIGWRAGRPPRSVLLTMGYSTMVFVVVTGFSIGLFFLPVPLLFLAAGVTSQVPTPHQATNWSPGEQR